MNHRQRQLAAIGHELPDRIPVDAIAIENREALGQYLQLDARDVGEHLGLDGRIITPRYIGDGRNEGRSEWATDAEEDYGTSHAFPLATASTIREIDDFAWPDPLAYDWERCTAEAWHLGDEYATRGPYWYPLFCRVCSLVGMEETLMQMVLDPALFEATLDHVFHYTEQLCRAFLAACGDSLDILYLGDDFGTQRGLMFDPALWRRFLKPRFARLFALGKETGRIVWFHSCGDITTILPDLIDIGMDVWETVQLHTLPMSPERLKREYGSQITFFGGINTQRLPFVGPDAIAEEVRQCIRVLGRGGGYICGPDHHIKPDVSAKNTLALFQTACQFRGEVYTLD